MDYSSNTVPFDEAVKTFMEEHQVSRAHARQQVAGAEIDRLCKVYMADHRVDYPTAYAAVLSDPRHSVLANAYARPQGLGHGQA